MKKPSKLIAFGLAISILLSPLAAYAQTFLDVFPEDWSYVYIEKLASVGALDDTPFFRPQDEATRAEVAEMLVRATVPEELQRTEDAQVFKDVPASHSENTYINTAYDLGWVTGYTDEITGQPLGFYGPEDNLLRAEVVTLIVRAIYSKVPALNPDLEGEVVDQPIDFPMNEEKIFRDVEKGSWYELYVYEAQKLGLVNGYKDEEGNLTGYFGPADYLTREQLAKIIALAMDIIRQNLLDQMEHYEKMMKDPYELEPGTPIGIEIRPVIEKEIFNGTQYVPQPSEKTFVAGSKNNPLASYEVKSLVSEDLRVAKLTFSVQPTYTGEGIASLEDLLESATLRYKDPSGAQQSHVASPKNGKLSFQGINMHAASQFSSFDLLLDFKSISSSTGAFSGNPFVVNWVKDGDLEGGYVDLGEFYAENLMGEKKYDGKAQTLNGHSTAFTLRRGRPIIEANETMKTIEGQPVADGEFKLLSFNVKADPQGEAIAFGSFGILFVAIDADPNTPLNLGEFKLYKNGNPMQEEIEVVADVPKMGDPEGFVYFVFKQQQVIQPNVAVSYTISTTVNNSQPGDLLAVYFSPNLETKMTLPNSPNPFKTTGYLVGANADGVLSPLESLITATKRYMAWSDVSNGTYSTSPGFGSYFWTNGYGLGDSVKFLYASWQKK